MNKEEIMKEIEHIANCELYDTIGVKYLRLNIEKLFEENQQLKERIEYLERSNNRREDTIIEQRQRLSDLEDNWNKNKERIDKAIEYIECHKYTIKHYEPYGTPTGLPNYETYNIKGYYQLLDILKEES